MAGIKANGTIIVGGVLEKDGKYLLVQEAQASCRGKWNIPAGYLDTNESILEGAKREIREETGCEVELTGLLQIGNRISPDYIWLGIVLSTKLISDNIKFNPDEILDVRWFSYDEILNMRNELRSDGWIIDSITAAKENKISDLNLIKITKSH